MDGNKIPSQGECFRTKAQRRQEKTFLKKTIIGKAALNNTVLDALIFQTSTCFNDMSLPFFARWFVLVKSFLKVVL